MGEIMLILVVALLVLGPAKLPDAAKQIGKAIRELRRHTQNLQETIEQDEHIGGTMRELKNALNEPIITTPRPRPPAVSPPADTQPQPQSTPADVPAAPAAVAAAATPPAVASVEAPPAVASVEAPPAPPAPSAPSATEEPKEPRPADPRTLEHKPAEPTHNG